MKIFETIKKFKRRLLFIFMAFLFICLILTHSAFAQEYQEEITPEFTEETIDQQEIEPREEEVFEAKIIEVLEEKEITRADGSKSIGQKLKLKGLKGQWKDKEIIFDGINENINYYAKFTYQKGDRVLVSEQTINGVEQYSIVDYVRVNKLYWLVALFVLVILLIGRWQGIKSILGLVFSFFIILKFIIPGILSGKDPLSITILYSFAIIIFSTYLIYGLNKKSNFAVIGTCIGLFVVGLLSVLFTNILHLTGTAEEEAIFIVDIMQSTINLKGLMLAGFIIGSLGVLDDITVSQASAAIEIHKANPKLSGKEIYKRTMRVGIDHISSMVNTLFLAYAGAFLPLLILFSIKQPPFATFSQVLNSEIIATEIARTLVGSIGLALAVPITTLITAYLIKKYYDKTP